jgi:hypothetical protein
MKASRNLAGPEPSRPVQASAFDFRAWRLESRQIAAAGAVLAYAAALWMRDARGDRALGALVVAETALLCLPWRLPRSQRSGASFWAETLVGLVAPVGALAVALVTGASWLRVAGAWWWYPLGVVAGLALLALSGMRPGALFSGEIAFALGPTRRSHARARSFTTAVGPPGEEALFRGPALVTPHVASFGLLAAVAFAARHHVQPGGNGRGAPRQTLTEVVAAAGFLLIALWSHSIYPAMVAHLVNNLPGFVVESQRDDPGTP